MAGLVRLVFRMMVPEPANRLFLVQAPLTTRVEVDQGIQVMVLKDLAIRVEVDLGIQVMVLADQTTETTRALQLHRQAASQTALAAMDVAARSAISSLN